MRSAQMKKDPTGGKSSNPSKGDGVKRSLSFGSLQGSVSIHDFHLLKVLGRGSFGKVFLVRPVRGGQSEVYAMKARSFGGSNWNIRSRSALSWRPYATRSSCRCNTPFKPATSCSW